MLTFYIRGKISSDEYYTYLRRRVQSERMR